MISLVLLQFAPPARRMHRSFALEYSLAGAESWPVSRSIRTRCLIGAKRPRGWLPARVVVLRRALPPPRPLPKPLLLTPRPPPLHRQALPARRLLPPQSRPTVLVLRRKLRLRPATPLAPTCA